MSDANRLEPVAHERQRYEAAVAAGALDKTQTVAELAEQDRKRELLTTAMEQWKGLEEQESEQRTDEASDLKFDRAKREDIWEQDQITSRQATMIDGVQVAARPCLVVNKLAVPVQQIENEGRQARLEPVVKAKPGTASDKDAEVRQGLLRSIAVSSNSAAARNWAFARVVRCGRGYYRIDIDYANDGDFELDIIVRRIKNQGTVYIDPHHIQPDASDMRYAFITEDLPHEEAKRRYPAIADIIATYHSDTAQFTSRTDIVPTWMTAKTVRLAEYFYVDESPQWRVEGLPDPVPTKDEAVAHQRRLEAATGELPRIRQVSQRRVKWALIGPGVVLEEHDWPGRYIPIVQMVGREINVDGKSTWKGVIRDSKDSVRIYCYGVSGQVETVALLPRAPWVAAFGQIEKFKRIWQLANQRAFSHLPYTPMDVNGTLAPPPQRTNVSADLSGVTALIMQADNDIKAQTGRWDASLGQINPNERSGKALREIKMQGELGSSHFMDSLAQAARHEGRIILDLARHVYVEPGRLLKLLGDTPGDETTIMANQPFIRDAQGQPQPAPTGARKIAMQFMAKVTGKPMPAVEHYDLTTGDFDPIVDVAPSYQTQRDENIALLQSMMEADPNLAPVLGDIMAEEIGGPMGRKIATRLRKLNPALSSGDEDGALPPEAQAKVGQLEQQLQMATQELQQAQQALAINEAKQQAQVQVATIKEQGALARLQAEYLIDRARLKAELDTEIEKMRASAASETQLAEFEAAVKKALQDDEQAHELRMEQLKGQLAAAARRDEAQRADAAEARGADRDDLREARESERAEAAEHRQAGREREARAFDADREDVAREHEAGEAQRDRDVQMRQARDAAATKPEKTKK